MFQPPPALSLKGKIAIVTGGSSSIGRAICIAYAQHGAKVVVADIRDTSRDPTESEATHELIRREGGESIFRKVDVTSEASVQAVIADTVKEYGRLDIMVNNAGVSLEVALEVPTPIWEMPVELYDKSVEINGRGVWLGCKHAIAQMLKQDPLPASNLAPGAEPSRGWIINMASVFSIVSTQCASAYASSKALATAITRSAALDAAPHHIHVNAICPGYIDTSLTSEQWERYPEARKEAEAQHPLNGGRFGKADEIAPLAVFLAGEGARWMTGSALNIDGGFLAQ